MKSLLARILSFAVEIAVLGAGLWLVRWSPLFYTHHELPLFLAVSLFPIIAFYAHRLERWLKIPYFVWAIILGWCFQSFLTPITSSTSTMGGLATFLGILIIFGGGLDIRFDSFKKIIWPVLSLSIIGALITAFIASYTILGVSALFNLPLSLATIALLGALLCSTDPAAIVTTLNRLRLRNPDNKVLAIAESAFNDVVGTIITTIFAAVILAGGAVTSIIGLYGHLFQPRVGASLVVEVVIGLLIGFICHRLLLLWTSKESTPLASFPFIIGVAGLAYVVAVALGSSGYLAVFIAGLLFEFEKGLHHVEDFFVRIVDGFVKPAVFLLLGTLITPSLWHYAAIGIIVAVLFIFVIRPIAVHGSLLFFSRGPHAFRFNDLLLLDSVRETGVIPAILLITFSPSIPNGEIAVAIGLWVILTTLIFLPIVTEPWAHAVRATK